MKIVGIDSIKHHVRNWPAAIAFYRDVLGLKLVYERPGLWAQFQAADGSRIGLVMEHEGVRRHPHAMLRVEDLEASLVALAESGAKVLDGPQHANYGSTALIEDPSGNVIELIEPK